MYLMNRLIVEDVQSPQSVLFHEIEWKICSEFRYILIISHFRINPTVLYASLMKSYSIGGW